MEVIFLGTSGSCPSKERACPSILVDRELLVDCGEGAVQRLLSLGAKLNAIKRIFISHVHADHISGITTLMWSFWLNRRTSNLRVYGPRGIRDVVMKFLELVRTPFENFLFEIEFVEIEEEEFKEGDIKTIFVDHTVATLALRVDRGKVFVYSSDTRPCERLIGFADKSDLLVHESTFPGDLRDFALKTGHSTARDAGKIARMCNAASLALFHIPPGFQSFEKELLEEAREEFEGRVLVARDNMRIVL